MMGISEHVYITVANTYLQPSLARTFSRPFLIEALSKPPMQSAHHYVKDLPKDAGFDSNFRCINYRPQ